MDVYLSTLIGLAASAFLKASAKDSVSFLSRSLFCTYSTSRNCLPAEFCSSDFCTEACLSMVENVEFDSTALSVVVVDVLSVKSLL